MTYSNNNIGQYAIGTTFDDSATRNIYNPPPGSATNANVAPYIGLFQPLGVLAGEGSLDSFLAAQLKTTQGINGTWTLITLDNDTSAPSSPQYMVNWSLTFGNGLTPTVPVALPNPAGGAPLAGGVNAAMSITAGLGLPSSAVPIGPGLVMAEDNTLGAFSPYEGRIYVAYTGYLNETVDGVKNVFYNTDIFLTYSDDGGRHWSAPIEVNNDSADSNGFSGANETNPNDVVWGNSQYQPAIAVDPTTGTVVASWRDTRNDPNEILSATYIASSIDGGKTFSAESYANSQDTAIDAITGQTKVLGPEADNGTALDNANNFPYGFGTSMGLAVYAGQVYPIWAANFDEASLVNNVPAGNALSIFYQPMVIAAGPRIISSTMGPVAASATSFTGTLTTGSSLITGVTSTAGMFAGEEVAGPGLPSGVTILTVDSATTLTVSALATANGAESLTVTADGYQQAAQTGQLSFTVTFDRPINAPSAVFTGTLTINQNVVTGIASTAPLFVGESLIGNGIPLDTTITKINSATSITLSKNATVSGAESLTPVSFTAADIEVFYHDTTFGDSSIPLEVLSVTPVAGSGVGPGSKFGYTEFAVVFSVTTQANGVTPSGIANYTGTYSYLVAPDNGNGDPIQESIPAYVSEDVTQTPLTEGPITENLPVPPNPNKPPGPGNNTTTAVQAVNNAAYNNAVITTVTVNVRMDDPAADGNQVVITLTAPDGQTDTVYNGTTQGATTLVGTITNTLAFPNSQVNGNYTLIIVDNVLNNTNGKLVNWSFTINSFASGEVLQNGDAMDQNADGTSDENALIVGFNGTLTSGSAVVTGITTTVGLFVGENVTGTGIQANTTIQDINSSTSVTLSSAATVSGVEALATSDTGLNQFTASEFDTPGDVYAVPAPNLPPLGSTTEIAYSGAGSILNKPTLGFNSNTVPLIISGPQVLTTQAVGTSQFVGTLTPNSALVTGILTTSGLFAGETVTGTGIPSGATIAAIDNLTTITLSSVATVTSSGAQSLIATGPGSVPICSATIRPARST